MNRREFLQQAGFAAGAIVAGSCTQTTVRAADRGGRCVIVRHPADRIAAEAPVEWAVTRLRDALAGRDVSVTIAAEVDQTPTRASSIIVAGRQNDTAAKLAAAAGVAVADSPESLTVTPVNDANGSRLHVMGSDARGLSYALTDLADAIALGDESLAALSQHRISNERPANRVRGIGRLFSSDVEDKPWYNDRGFWGRYLDLLASQRFNRFHLALGLGYDFARGVKDSYFYFPYPFLLGVPGYQVRAAGLPDSERDNNLAMLRFIGNECAARGIDFQLGLWGHQYEFADSPDVNYRIEGLTGENHANYCRDALAALLKACPSVTGVTFRIHGESGIAEGSYDFWKTVFDGVVRCGRKVPIEMHAKGSDQKIIDTALATGMPVTMAPKYCAEHMGLPYCQASIRPTELPRAGRKDEGFFAKSSGSRSFLRYGYGDLLAEDRRYEVVHRMWPGTQRVLLWGDPVFAAAFGRTSSFCGSAGAELFEPMSFKGRMGSGRPGGRQGYADDSLKTADDFEKYRYWYVLWGRLLYNPDADPETWRRVLRHEYGNPAAPAVEQALASAGRILPMVTTANSQSASYNAYWVEMPYNMPIVDPARRHPYGDTPSGGCSSRAITVMPPPAISPAKLRTRTTSACSPVRLAHSERSAKTPSSPGRACICRRASCGFPTLAGHGWWYLDNVNGKFAAGFRRYVIVDCRCSKLPCPSSSCRHCKPRFDVRRRCNNASACPSTLRSRGCRASEKGAQAQIRRGASGAGRSPATQPGQGAQGQSAGFLRSESAEDLPRSRFPHRADQCAVGAGRQRWQADLSDEQMVGATPVVRVPGAAAGGRDGSADAQAPRW